MPHIHKDYDFVISVFIVHQNKVLFVHHKRYNEWLPIGGHIELDEDPEQALFREIEEESGLSVRIMAKKPRIGHPGVKPILTPSYVDVHQAGRGHQHIAFVYFALSENKDVRLHQEEHREFRWFSRSELKESQYKIISSIQYYGRKALDEAKLWQPGKR